jgi:hypothetical protein
VTARLSFLAILIAASAHADPVTFDFSSLGTSQIIFDGSSSTIAFSQDSSGYDFQISDSNVPGLASLDGNIGGTFSIGPITSTSFGFLTVQDAPVSGTGTFTIFDGSLPFSASVNWVGIETVGSGGSLNTDGTINLSNFSFAGTNASLTELANSAGGIASVSFQFSQIESIDQLASGGADNATSYSGSVTAVNVSDAQSTAMLLGISFFLSCGPRATSSLPALKATAHNCCTPGIDCVSLRKRI